MEGTMLNHELRRDDGILVIRPEGPFEAADFTTVASHVDAYLESHGTLSGMMIHAKAFPGWKDLGALLAHLKFVIQHHKKIARIALVADGNFATVMPSIAGHFIHAQVRGFDLAHERAALEWLKANDRFWMRSAA